MNYADIANGIFEAGLSYFLFRNLMALRRDKTVRGVYIPTTIWTTAWGFWNLYYYPSLEQWASFWGGVAVVSFNAIWLAHVWFYTRGQAWLNRITG